MMIIIMMMIMIEVLLTMTTTKAITEQRNASLGKYETRMVTFPFDIKFGRKQSSFYS